MSRKVAIIGGGAAGLVAAISAARNGSDVTILEASEAVGKKILQTGNGRCNFSNVHVHPDDYNDPAFVEPVLEAEDSLRVRHFFESLGLLHVTDAEGRVYPSSNSANSVLDVLRLECDHLGVREQRNFQVVDVRPRINPNDSQPPFTLVAQSGTWINADAVILATGSDFSLIPLVGHTKHKAQPVLCPIKTTIDRIRSYNGIRVDCEATLYDAGTKVRSERGELLFREYGVSGIMVFDLSRYAQAGQQLVIDLFPDISMEGLRAQIEKRAKLLPWRRPEDFLAGMLHPRIAQTIVRNTGLNSDLLATALKLLRLEVIGPGDARQAQVTRGGVVLSEVDPRTLASRRAPGLFLAGEVLDVDGRCGGYNLHWAWASGLVAGRNAALYDDHQQPLFRELQ